MQFAEIPKQLLRKNLNTDISEIISESIVTHLGEGI